ncbi:hypothetical protein GGX14DRAFT_390156 [Mycena pura]|uniref:Uncharacterized protein n=1 Tax=Mycena pura TaxID=153505 RepID=A0AAD6VNI0_9AGAR|nr:hypothetical protein GGX14DRAFT_390156 [Mycena pura]
MRGSLAWSLSSDALGDGALDEKVRRAKAHGDGGVVRGGFADAGGTGVGAAAGGDVDVDGGAREVLTTYANSSSRPWKILGDAGSSAGGVSSASLPLSKPASVMALLSADERARSTGGEKGDALGEMGNVANHGVSSASESRQILTMAQTSSYARTDIFMQALQGSTRTTHRLCLVLSAGLSARKNGKRVTHLDGLEEGDARYRLQVGLVAGIADVLEEGASNGAILQHPVALGRALDGSGHTAPNSAASAICGAWGLACVGARSDWIAMCASEAAAGSFVGAVAAAVETELGGRKGHDVSVGKGIYPRQKRMLDLCNGGVVVLQRRWAVEQRTNDIEEVWREGVMRMAAIGREQGRGEREDGGKGRELFDYVVAASTNHTSNAKYNKIQSVPPPDWKSHILVHTAIQ